VTPAEFRSRYEAAFATFVDERSEQSLRAAYELGRDAVKAELSVLEIAGAHHDSLARVLARVSREDIATLSTAAGDFLVESLAAFEMVQRGFSDARRAAFLERRNARMLRQLSTLLADESLATGDRESLEEILQLVSEQAREMTDALSGSVHVRGGAQATAAIDVQSQSDGDDTWSEVLQPRVAAQPAPRNDDETIRAPLLSLDGSSLGWIEVKGKKDGRFSLADEALLRHVAQMTAAAVERALAYLDV
jgi:Phosphoserine phosphatase RsbU, N-terminal domain